jgi:TonB family protein
MNKIKKSIICLSLFLFLGPGIFADDQIVIESNLFRAIIQASDAYPQEVIITSFSAPFFIPETSKSTELKSESIASLKNELNKVFQVRRIDHLLSGNMIWDGKKGILIETISLDEFSYPLHFSPEVISKNSVNLQVEMFRRRNTDAAIGDDKLEKLLDTEIVINFDKPIILGFPINGNTYFLSIYITRRSSDTLLRGKVIQVPSSTPIMMPPRPVYRFNPIYPVKCKNSQIEGSVIAEVSTDTRGYVNRVRVLKPAHPDLDRAALLALKQWRYEPLSMNEEPVPAVFVVSVDFKLRGLNSIQEQRTGKDAQTDLDRILINSASYCEKLENAALYFVCKEEVNEDVYRGPSTGKNNTIYDYSFQKKKDEIAEGRILREENGKKCFEMDAKLKTNVFLSERALFAPVGLISESVQDLYDYELVKEDEIFGRKAYVIKATPKKENNSNHGKLWIDKENFCVLKIEMKQESLAGYVRLGEDLKEHGIEPVLLTTHYYEVEKKGVRFPSRTDFLENYKVLSRFRSRQIRRSRTVIEFSDYQFLVLKQM